jgi:signal transduction histidine kinase
MPRPLGISPDHIYLLLDWFIPESLKAETGTLRRVRMFMISHLFGPFLGHTISLCLLALAPSLDISWWIFCGAITLFWVFPIGLKLNVSYPALALLSVQNLTFTILWGCYAYGGLNSPLIPWVITIPLLAFFYLGSGWAVQSSVVALILVNLLLFYALSDGGRVLPEHIPLASLSSLGIVSTVCAAAYVSMMALYYAKIVSSQPELEREVAHRLETAERLRQATDEADLANKAKSDFLARMSHELRTPLNAVIGYSAMLLEDMEEVGRDQQCCDLRKIEQAGEHLLSLINDLLDLSKLDVGKMELHLEPLNVRVLVGDVIASYRAQIVARGNTLEVDCPSDAGHVEGDATKLGRVLASLLSNAAKFTQDGTIGVTVTRDDEWLAIMVRDTGAGIEAKRLRTLFENFDEDEEATTSKYGGPGLGLPLSSKLCELMGGDLTVESKRGNGSCFMVRVPVSRAGNTCRSAAPALVSALPTTPVLEQAA